MRCRIKRSACIIGAGPNGLAAAIVLALAGLRVDVFEAESIPGGGARTMELTRPGFLHDFGSAVHPFAVGSPFFSSLPLSEHDLEWIHSPAPLAHPLEDGTAVMLERDLGEAARVLGGDGPAWRALMQPFAERWSDLASGALRPVTLFPRHPFLMARFGLHALHSARSIAEGRFHSDRTRALFAGLAAHSVMSLNDLLSGPFGLLIAISAHAVGWPIPRGGAQCITNALCGYLAKLGGKIHTAMRVETLSGLPGYDLILCDITPRQMLHIGGNKLSSGYKDQLAGYQYGPGVFKVDYALSNPIPWKAKECMRAATIHIGGNFEEIATSEEAMATGHHSDRPFLILAQPSLFDPTRAPQGKHTAWVYCHVPNGSKVDMLPRIEAQIERFAPGFQDCVLARRVFSPADLEAMDANLVGGDIGGGAMTLRQFLFRPTHGRYATSLPGLYLCSSSTPPGGGVHGMCGYHAAREALKKLG